MKVIGNKDEYTKRVVSMKNGTLMKVRSRVDHVENLLFLVSAKSNSNEPEPETEEIRQNFSLVGSRIEKNKLQYL